MTGKLKLSAEKKLTLKIDRATKNLEKFATGLDNKKDPYAFDVLPWAGSGRYRKIGL